jgi:CO/xanthine dehydrogenase FAD-binding subunit
MIKPELACPTTVDEAVAALAATTGSRPMAGGTDLLVQLRRGGGGPPPPLLVSLHAVRELSTIERRGEVLCIGAGVTLARLVDSEVVAEAAPLLREVAAGMASPHVRSRATLGGNLCNASPAADLVPPLLVHEARVVLKGPSGERALPLAELLVGPGKTARQPAELLVAVEVPALPAGSGAASIKHQVGRCAELSIVSVAAAVVPGDRGRCAGARIALGAVAPTAIRLPEVEKTLAGAALDEAALAEAGRRASETCRPIDDIRSSCDHRCHLVEVLVPRALREAAARAGLEV